MPPPITHRLLHLACPARMAHLPELMALVEQACDEAGAGEQARYAIRLAVEEIAVNVISYGYPDREPGPIELSLAWDEDQMTIVIEDRAACFAPTDAPAPDLDSSWDKRSPGGLGWYLVQAMVDTVQHRHEPANGNRYTLVKRLAS
jgi:anti-sigma regulatory factor (Ser/Thr protein kinase)